MENYFMKKSSERNEKEIQTPGTNSSQAQPQCSFEIDIAVVPSTIRNDIEENYDDINTDFNAAFPDDLSSLSLNSSNIHSIQQLSQSPSNVSKVKSDQSDGEESYALKSDNNGDFSSLEETSLIRLENIVPEPIFMVSSALGKTLTHQEKLTS